MVRLAVGHLAGCTHGFVAQVTHAVWNLQAPGVGLTLLGGHLEGLFVVLVVEQRIDVAAADGVA